MTHNQVVPLRLSMLVTMFLAGCGGQGEVRVLLTDAPLDGATAVNVTLESVEVRQRGGWETISMETATFNLLELQDGVTAPLGETALPEGEFTEMRLVLADNGAHAVVNETGEHPLDIPSGESSGIKLKGCFVVEAGETTEVVVDFDAGASVSGDDATGYSLRPTIKLVSDPDCQGGDEED